MSRMWKHAIHVAAPPERVWAALVENRTWQEDGVTRSTFGDTLAPNQRCRVLLEEPEPRFGGTRNCGDLTARIVEVTPPRTLIRTLGVLGSTRLEHHLEPEGEGTRLTVRATRRLPSTGTFVRNERLAYELERIRTVAAGHD